MANPKPFAITNPDFTRRMESLARANPTLIVRDSAVEVAHKLVAPLKEAAQRAGASSAMVDAITVHDGHLNHLVMRDRGTKGDVIVGVDGRSTTADEADELEWGSIEAGPKSWVRTTVAKKRGEVVTMWSNALTRHLDAAAGR